MAICHACGLVKDEVLAVHKDMPSEAAMNEMTEFHLTFLCYDCLKKKLHHGADV